MVLTWWVLSLAFSKLNPVADKYYSGGLPVSGYCESHSIEYNVVKILISFLFVIIIGTMVYYGGYKILFIYFLYSVYGPCSVLFELPHPYLPLACKLFFTLKILPFVLLLVILLTLKKIGKLTSEFRTIAFTLVYFICCLLPHFIDIKSKFKPITSRIRAEERKNFYEENAVPETIRVNYKKLHRSIIEHLDSLKIFMLPSSSSSFYNHNLNSVISRSATVFSQEITKSEYQQIKDEYLKKARHVQRSCDTTSFVNTVLQDDADAKRNQNLILKLPSDFTVMVLYAGLHQELDDYNNWESSYSCGIAISDLTYEIRTWVYYPTITYKGE